MIDILQPSSFVPDLNFSSKLSQLGIQHDTGYFILGPSGCGKSHFIDRQVDKQWIDGDELWKLTNAQPLDDWWRAPDDAISLREIDARSDIITFQAVQQGFWIIGASNLWLRPDAIVLPPWDVHLQYLNARLNEANPEGATADNFEKVQIHRRRIEDHAKNTIPLYRSIDIERTGPVPIFESIALAASFLGNNYK